MGFRERLYSSPEALAWRESSRCRGAGRREVEKVGYIQDCEKKTYRHRHHFALFVINEAAAEEPQLAVPGLKLAAVRCQHLMARLKSCPSRNPTSLFSLLLLFRDLGVLANRRQEVMAARGRGRLSRQSSLAQKRSTGPNVIFKLLRVPLSK